MTLADLQNPAGGRQVTYIPEGALIDPRQNAPLGNGPTNIEVAFGIKDLTVFVTPRPGGKGQAYFVFSDTEPLPEPGTLVLASLGGLGLLGRVVRTKAAARKRKEHS
jgi:hypothetical protein